MREAMKEFPGDKLKTVEKLVKKRKNVKKENIWVIKAEVRGSRMGAKLTVDSNGKQKSIGNRAEKKCKIHWTEKGLWMSQWREVYNWEQRNETLEFLERENKILGAADRIKNKWVI